jgi:hypothetical protein
MCDNPDPQAVKPDVVDCLIFISIGPIYNYLLHFDNSNQHNLTRVNPNYPCILPKRKYWFKVF